MSVGWPFSLCCSYQSTSIGGFSIFQYSQFLSLCVKVFLYVSILLPIIVFSHFSSLQYHWWSHICLNKEKMSFIALEWAFIHLLSYKNKIFWRNGEYGKMDHPFVSLCPALASRLFCWILHPCPPSLNLEIFCNAIICPPWFPFYFFFSE